MLEPTMDTFTCPHCKAPCKVPSYTNVNVDIEPEKREKVQDLSIFEWTCPNCDKTSLVLHPCLYHDMTNEFMVWFTPADEEILEKTDFSPLESYTLRRTATPNEFREKINILERRLDDRAMELTKLILIMQMSRDDIDAVDLIFHDIDAEGNFLFVIVHPDGVEQFVSLPPVTYERLVKDVRETLYTPSKSFLTVDLAWAKDTLELLRAK